MPSKPSLALARWIVKSYNNDGFLPVIVEGDERIGKSTYVMKSFNQALSYLAQPKINKNNWRKYLGWNPFDVIETWANKPSNVKYVGYWWDDAGVWLNNLQWSDPLLLEVQKYISIVGSDYAFFAMTTPKAKWILGKINAIPGMIRVIIHRTSGSSMIGQMPENVRWGREAKAYRPWYSPDLKKSGVRKVMVDDFKCKMDDDIYEWYKPLRDSFNDLIKQRMHHQLIAQMKSQHLRDLQLETKGLRWQNQLRKLEKVKRKFEEADKDMPKDVSSDPDEVEEALLKADIDDRDVGSEKVTIHDNGLVEVDPPEDDEDLEGSDSEES